MQKRNLLFAIISGVLLALAMPPPGLWPLAWIGMVPLFLALRETRARSALLLGLIAGTTYFAIVLFWISLFGYLPWAMLAVVEGLFIALFAVVTSRVLPSKIGWWGYLAVPAVWTVMQWARSLGPYSLTWGSFAHMHADVLAVAQLASVTGPWGIEFLICLANIALLQLIAPVSNMQRYAPAVLAAFIAATVTLTGWLVLSQPMPEPSKTVEVAIIQGNKEHEVNVSAEYIKDAFFAYVGMSREAAEKEVDLIIWPETTIVDVVTESGWGGLISELAKMTNTSYIVGGYDRADDPSCPLSHNGAHFYNQHGEKIGVYRKVRLVPFGEFVPLRDKLPLLNNYGIRNTDVLPGKSHKLIDTQFGKAGVSICFESLFPHISRSETKRGAEMLFVLTNDSWFKRTPAAHQHLMMSQLRAIENSRWIVRAAATGESALIDPNGRVVKMLPIYEKGILIGEVAPREDVTIFTHLGDYFAYLSIAAVMLGLIKSINRRKLS